MENDYDVIRDLQSLPSSVEYEGITFEFQFKHDALGIVIGYKLEKVLPTSKHYTGDNQIFWTKPVWNKVCDKLCWVDKIYSTNHMKEGIAQLKRMLKDFKVS